jgi:hypothetical protein
MRHRRRLLGGGAAAVAVLAVVGGVAAWPTNQTTAVAPAKAPEVKTAKIGEKVPVGDPTKPGGAYAWIAQENGEFVFHFKVTGCPKDDPARLDKNGAVSQTAINDGYASPITCAAPGAKLAPVGLVVDKRPASALAFTDKSKAAMELTKVGKFWLLTAQLAVTKCMLPTVRLPEVQSQTMGYIGDQKGCEGTVDNGTPPFAFGEKAAFGSGAYAWIAQKDGKATLSATLGQGRTLSSPIGDIPSSDGKLAFCKAGAKTVFVAAGVPAAVQKVGWTYGGEPQGFDFVQVDKYWLGTVAIPVTTPCAAGMQPVQFKVFGQNERTVALPVQVL